jgi:hypothetical protein
MPALQVTSGGAAGYGEKSAEKRGIPAAEPLGTENLLNLLNFLNFLNSLNSLNSLKYRFLSECTPLFQAVLYA